MNRSMTFAGVTVKINEWRPGDPLCGHNRLVALDTETHLIDENKPSEYPPVVTMQVYGGGDDVDLVWWEYIPQYLALLLAEPVYIVFHNCPFDIGVLGLEQFIPLIDAGRIVDTGLQWTLRKIATQGLGDDRREYPKLSRVCQDILGMHLDKDATVRCTFNRNEYPDEAHILYACGDAIATWKACVNMRPQATMDIQVKGFLALDHISRIGIHADTDRMTLLRKKYIDMMNLNRTNLLVWGIRLDRDKDSKDICDWLRQELEIPLPEMKSVGSLPIQMIRWLVAAGLRWHSIDDIIAAFPEGQTSGWALPAKGATRLDWVSVEELTKRQGIHMCLQIYSNLMEDRDGLEGLKEFWDDHEGWPAGWKRKGPELVLQELMKEAEDTTGITLPRTKTGKFGLSDEALDEVDDEVLEKLPFLADYKAYKHSEKLVSTFLDAKIIKADGKVHTRFVPLLATGRTSSQAPNLQNITKERGIREIYYAPPGYVLCSCDYNQQELIALAQYCYTEYGVSRMRDLANHDVDIHAYMGGTIEGIFIGLPDFNVDEPGILAAYKDRIAHFKKKDSRKFKARRQLSKALNFGLPGGLGSTRFIVYARGYGVKLSVQESAELCALWKNTFPEMEYHLQPTPMTGARFKGKYEVTTLTGRRRVNCSFCAALNTKFQGFAADISKAAGWELMKAGVHNVLMIHDEYVAVLPFDGYLTERAKFMEKIMVDTMQAFTPDVRCKAEAALMFRWSKAAEPYFDGEGDLLPWEFVPQSKDEKGVLVPVPWDELPTERQHRVLNWKRRMIKAANWR